MSGSAKLVQDLRCAILEPMGTDSMHPTYGSTLDGGVGPDGTVYPGVIGDMNDDTTAGMVKAELSRLTKIYQGQQLVRNNADIATYGRSTLSVGEALLGVTNTELRRVATFLLVNATLQTGGGSIPLVQSFSG